MYSVPVTPSQALWADFMLVSSTVDIWASYALNDDELASCKFN